MSDFEPRILSTTFYGWRYNSANKHNPKWIHPAAMPDGYSLGGTLSIREARTGYWEVSSRFVQAAWHTMPYHRDNTELEVLVVHDGRLWVCRHRGEFKPLPFTSGKTMPNAKTGEPTTVDPQELVDKMSQLMELRKKQADLMCQYFGALAREYGEW